ncbi:UDP-glucose 4-epimerase GalE [Candidatus Gracilibacteria bacterium]|nr:UDP-glucose 4-epimerase GalE [Candidatus Gracilibacteria bacterium]
MNSKKILITGGLGYIGSHTALVFAQAGYEPILLDNLSNAYKDQVQNGFLSLLGYELPLYEGDVRDADLLKKIFEEHEFIGVIHFAAKKAVGESCHDPFLYYENNIMGTINLLEVMNNVGLKNILFSSSATVYDVEKNIPPFTETDRINTTNPYGTTKLVMEYILKDMVMHKQFRSVVLRYFNPIGAHSSGLLGENPKGIPTNLLPFLLRVAKKEIEKITVFGDDYPTPDGTCIRDYIHIEDLAQAHLASFEYLLAQQEENQEEKPDFSLFEVFNIGTGIGKSVQEMIALVQNITGEEIQVEMGERRDGDVAVSVANPTKAKQLLSREAQRSIMQAIQDARNYYSQQ